MFCASSSCVNNILNEVADIFRVNLYRYNTTIKRYGLYLKPVHVVVKKSSSGTKVYHYYGRYWYKVVYSRGRLRWVYVSKEKPIPELPDPPVNPFTAIKIVNEDGDRVCLFVDDIYSLGKVYQYFVEALNKVKCVELGYYLKYRY